MAKTQKLENLIKIWVLAEKFVKRELHPLAWEQMAEAIQALPELPVQMLAPQFVEEAEHLDRRHAQKRLSPLILVDVGRVLVAYERFSKFYK